MLIETRQNRSVHRFLLWFFMQARLALKRSSPDDRFFFFGMFGYVWDRKKDDRGQTPIITESVKVYSLETNSQFAPGVFPGPKRKRESLPTIHFQGRTVSFREDKLVESSNNRIPMIGLFEHIVL